MSNKQKLMYHIYEIYTKYDENMDGEYVIREVELEKLKLSSSELYELFTDLDKIGCIDFICKQGEFYKYTVKKFLVELIKKENKKRIFEESTLLNIQYGNTMQNYYTTGIKEFDYAAQLVQENAVFIISKEKDKIGDNLLIHAAVENALSGVKVLLVTWLDLRTVDRMIMKYIKGIDFQMKNTKDNIVDEKALQQDILSFKDQSIEYITVAKNLSIIGEVKNVGDGMDRVTNFINNYDIELVVSSVPFTDAKMVSKKAVIFSFSITSVDLMSRYFNKTCNIYFDSKKDVYMVGGFSMISGVQYGFDKKDDKIIIMDPK